MPRRKSQMPFVTKREFCSRVFEKGAFDRKMDVEKFYDSFCECLHELLMNGEQIALPGVGSFTIEDRPARNALNPKTGERLYIPAGQFIKFTQTKALKSMFRQKWEKEGIRVLSEDEPFPEQEEKE